MGLADLLSSDDDDEDEQLGFDYLVTKASLDDVDSVTPYCPAVGQVKQMLRELNTEECLDPSFLSEANSVMERALDSISSIHSFIKLNYKPVWPDLEALVKNPVNFAHVIAVIGDDVAQVGGSDQLELFLKKDEVLALKMSASLMQRKHLGSTLDRHRLDLVQEACQLILTLSDARKQVGQFVATRAGTLAPNITAIVGSSTTAQILSLYGLDGLVKTPACNLASLGVNNSAVGAGIRNKGYIYECELVRSVPEDYKKQAIRLVAAKLALAARVDYANRGNGDSGFGEKCHREILAKLDKLQAPPDNQRIKPLAKPIDKKSSRRAGRRFRKQKERMRMSEVEKAKNRVVFGDREQTLMDSYGEEVGLGMAGKFSSDGAYRLKPRKTIKPAAKTVANTVAKAKPISWLEGPPKKIKRLE